MLPLIRLNLLLLDMDIRIENKTFKQFIAILILFLGISCTNSSISEMEELVGIPMQENLNLIKRESQWYDFTGDGYKMEIYKVNCCFIKKYSDVLISKGFYEYNPSLWKQSETYPYIENSHGLYKRFSKNHNEEIYIFFNFNSCTIIYLLVIL